MIYFYKKNIRYNNKYNLICILVFLINILIFCRALLDKNFSIANGYYSIYASDSLKSYDYSLLYLEQNYFFFIILLIGCLLFHYININHKESKYSGLSKLCFIISIGSLFPTICNLSSDPKMLFLLFVTVILIVVEIEELVRNNHKKKEWIIYVSFVFNMLALISFFIK